MDRVRGVPRSHRVVAGLEGGRRPPQGRPRGVEKRLPAPVAVDGFRPTDRYDLAGAALCLVGVAVIMYAPNQLEPACPGRPGGITVIEADKTIVRRLVDEVSNGGYLEVIDELYAPELAGGSPAVDRALPGQLPRRSHGARGAYRRGRQERTHISADAGTGPDAPTRCGIGSVV